MIAEEGRRLAWAAQLLTRLPAPQVAWRDDAVARSARYFSLVGLVIGGVCAVVFLGARWIWPQGPLPALLAVAAGVLITGAYHEDGLADAADGLGGGHTPDRRREIMKDSRIGAFGVLALGLTITLKVTALSLLPAPLAVLLLPCAHAGGRAVAASAMAWQPYGGRPQGSRLGLGDQRVHSTEAVIALLIGGAPFILLKSAAVCVFPALLLAAIPLLAAQRLIGGYTGDVLGAGEQMFETGAMLGAAAWWSLQADVA